MGLSASTWPCAPWQQEMHKNEMAGAYPPCAFGLTREIMYATALGFAGLGVFKVRTPMHGPSTNALEGLPSVHTPGWCTHVVVAHHLPASRRCGTAPSCRSRDARIEVLNRRSAVSVLAVSAQQPSTVAPLCAPLVCASIPSDGPSSEAEAALRAQHPKPVGVLSHVRVYVEGAAYGPPSDGH